MKYFIISLCLISFASCSKIEPRTDCTVLIGEWEWTRTYGSIAGQDWTPQNTGDTRKIQLNETDISFFENGNFIQSFPYSFIATDSITNDGVVRTFIKYSNKTRWIIHEECSLQFRDLCPDCYDDYYEKIQ